MQAGTPTVENCMDFSQKTKNGISFSPSDSTAENYHKNPETQIEKSMCIPMSIAALIYNSQVLETALVPITK